MTELPELKEITIKVGEGEERVRVVVTPASGESSPMVTLVPKDAAQQERLLALVEVDKIRAGVEDQLKQSQGLEKVMVAVGVPPKQKV